jgi:hypothetical protein
MSTSSPSSQPELAGSGSAVSPPPIQPQQRRGWVPFTIGGLVVCGLAGVAVAALVVFGGKPQPIQTNVRVPAAVAISRAAAVPEVQDLLGVFESQSMTAVIPATWVQGKGSNAKQLLLSDPDVPAVQLIIAHGPANTDLASQARAQSAHMGGRPKPAEVKFPGGRTAWRLEGITSDGARQVTYLFDECSQAVTVTGIAPPTDFNGLRRRFGIVASLAHVNC